MASSDSGASLALRLVAIEYGARNINIYRFAPTDGSALPPFEPGAHVDLEIKPGVTRQYSLLWSAPSPDSYAIAVQEANDGRGGSTAWHRESVVGEVYSVSVPRNHFALETTPGAQSCLIAGGIGITPIVSMYRKLVAEGRRVKLHYWARSAEHTLMHDELRRVTDGSVVLIHSAGKPIFTSLQDVLQTTPPDAQLYCCGPASMITEFEALTADRDPALVHRERFSASPTQTAAPGQSFVVRLARSNKTLVISPEQSVLGACLEAGIDVSYSCEEGVCGACEVRVLSGQVEHRDSVLSAAARAGSDSMMVCCSRGKSELVLDL
jgi:vanillate O-demethylase ferredoxin subunit